MYLKLDNTPLVDVSEMFPELWLFEHGKNPLCFESSPWYTWNCGNETYKIDHEEIIATDLFSSELKNVTGGNSTVMSAGYIKTDEH